MRTLTPVILAFIAGSALPLTAATQKTEPSMTLDIFEPDICFAIGSDQLDEVAKQDVKNAAGMHRNVLEINISRVVVVAFPDAKTPVTEAEALAKRRATNIADLLAAQGVAVENIAVDWKDYSIPEGYGYAPHTKSCNLAAHIFFDQPSN
jgi:outer membrane protein OmpA-like peptidoglycan-associated protein